MQRCSCAKDRTKPWLMLVDECQEWRAGRLPTNNSGLHSGEQSSRTNRFVGPAPRCRLTERLTVEKRVSPETDDNRKAVRSTRRRTGARWPTSRVAGLLSVRKESTSRIGGFLLRETCKRSGSRCPEGRGTRVEGTGGKQPGSGKNGSDRPSIALDRADRFLDVDEDVSHEPSSRRPLLFILRSGPVFASRPSSRPYGVGPHRRAHPFV